MAWWTVARDGWMAVAIVLATVSATPALAQESPPLAGSAGDAPMPGFMQPGSGPLHLLPTPGGNPSPLPEAATPYAPSTAPAVETKPLATVAPRETATLSLTARLTPDGPPLGAGVVGCCDMDADAQFVSDFGGEIGDALHRTQEQDGEHGRAAEDSCVDALYHGIS